MAHTGGSQNGSGAWSGNMSSSRSTGADPASHSVTSAQSNIELNSVYSTTRSLTLGRPGTYSVPAGAFGVFAPADTRYAGPVNGTAAYILYNVPATGDLTPANGTYSTAAASPTLVANAGTDVTPYASPANDGAAGTFSFDTKLEILVPATLTEGNVQVDVSNAILASAAKYKPYGDSGAKTLSYPNNLYVPVDGAGAPLVATANWSQFMVRWSVKNDSHYPVYVVAGAENGVVKFGGISGRHGVRPHETIEYEFDPSTSRVSIVSQHSN